MSVNGPLTGLVTYDTLNDVAQDLGLRYVSKDYLIDAYPNLIPGLVTPGLFMFGDNILGELGNKTTVNYSSPIQVGSLNTWKQVSCGYGFSLAIKTDGTLWAWGYNANGQLGNNTLTYYSSPIQVGSLTTWKQVSAGYISTMAIKTDGTLWGWGGNANGQLANTSTSLSFSSPIQIGSLTNWKTVSNSIYNGFWIAIKTDGSLWGCGYNQLGQLGNNTRTNYSSPIQIGSLTDWKTISAGMTETFAIKTDGTLWGWGNNAICNLGNGNTTSYSSPIQIGSLTNWKQISASDTTYAIKTDGTLWGWGGNASSNIGTGGNIINPTQIGTLTNWKQVSAGNHPTDWYLALKTDGSIWGSGLNADGQLGNENYINSSSPIQIGTLTTWKQVSAGFNHSGVIKDGYA